MQLPACYCLSYLPPAHPTPPPLTQAAGKQLAPLREDAWAMAGAVDRGVWGAGAGIAAPHSVRGSGAATAEAAGS